MSRNVKWEVLLEQHNKLIKKSASTLYDRVVLLVKIFEHPQFLKDMIKGEQPPKDFLSKQLSDVAFDFTISQLMLEKYPKKEQWLEITPTVMRDNVLEEIHRNTNKKRSDSRKKNKDKKTRDSVTRREYQELHQKFTSTVEDKDQKIALLQAEVKHWKEMYEAKNAELDRLLVMIGEAPLKAKFAGHHDIPSPEKKKSRKRVKK